MAESSYHGLTGGKRGLSCTLVRRHKSMCYTCQARDYNAERYAASQEIERRVGWPWMKAKDCVREIQHTQRLHHVHLLDLEFQKRRDAKLIGAQNAECVALYVRARLTSKCCCASDIIVVSGVGGQPTNPYRCQRATQA